MTYEKFMLALWRELKSVAVDPAFSVGEFLLFLTLIAWRLSPWIMGPILLAWIITRNSRRSA